MDEKSDRIEKIVKRATIVLVAFTLVASLVVTLYVEVFGQGGG